MQKTQQFSIFKLKNAINKFLLSKYYLFLMGTLTLLFHFLCLEIVFYIIVGAITLYICLFADDFLPLVSLFIFCYICPSAKNNPGISESSIFYSSSSSHIMIAILCLCIPAIFLRIGLDKKMGFRRFFSTKRKLLSGMCFLGISYIISGLGSTHWNDIIVNNILFSVIQFCSIFLLYYIFTATIDWTKIDKDYLAWLGIIIGLVVTAELLGIYINNDIIQNGSIIRKKMLTGWGHRNNIGAMIALSIPFAFSLACTKKNGFLFLLISYILLAGLLLSSSRASMLFGSIIFVICVIILIFKAKYKKPIHTTLLISFLIIGSLSIFFNQELSKLFENIPSIIESTENGISFNDSSRFIIYEEGINAFLKNPIFGQSFYANGFVPYGFSTVTSFSTLFPPRWHNTIIQLLSSCGLFGILAYGFHRLQTFKLFITKPSTRKTFVGLSILVFLTTSLLDCHFFNVGPTLFYSICLAFAEKQDSKNLNNFVNFD